MNEKQNKQVSDEIDVQALLKFVLRKWYVFAIAWGVVGALVVALYLIQPKKYQSSGKVQIVTNDESSLLGGLNVGGSTGVAMDMLGLGSKSVDDEIEIMQSRALIANVINDLRIRTDIYLTRGLRETEIYNLNSPLLLIYPENLENEIKGTLEVEVNKKADSDIDVRATYMLKGEKTECNKHLTSFNESIELPCGEISFGEIPQNIENDEELVNGYKIHFVLQSLNAQIDDYNEKLSVHQSSKNSSLVAVSMLSSSPEKNEAVIGKLIEFYNQDAKYKKNRSSVELSNFLSERIAIISESMHQSDAEVEEFRSKNDIANIDMQSQLFLETTSEYSTRIAEIDVQYSVISFVENYLTTSDEMALIPTNTGIEDESLSKMLVDYNKQILDYLRVSNSTTANNPIVQVQREQIKLSRQNIVQTIANLKKSLDITKSDLQQQSREYQAKIDEVPALERQYVELEREHKMTQALYLALLQKREQAQLMLASASDAAVVIDQPYTDDKAQSPRLMIYGLVAIVLGFCLACVYLYGYTLLYNSVQSEEELKSLTTLPMLGVVPHVKKMTIDLDDSISQAFVNIRAKLRFAIAGGAQNVILVTSNGEQEGKSVCAAQLALSLAKVGQRVALVDVNLHKPTLADLLNVDNNIGLTDYVQNADLQLNSVLKQTSQNAHLSVLTTGVLTPDSPELLLNERVAQLFSELRANYDYVVIDSAAVDSAPETKLLGKMVDVTLFVVRAKVTSQDVIKSLDDQSTLPNVSLVLNDLV